MTFDPSQFKYLYNGRPLVYDPNVVTHKFDRVFTGRPLVLTQTKARTQSDYLKMSYMMNGRPFVVSTRYQNSIIGMKQTFNGRPFVYDSATASAPVTTAHTIAISIYSCIA